MNVFKSRSFRNALLLVTSLSLTLFLFQNCGSSLTSKDGLSQKNIVDMNFRLSQLSATSFDNDPDKNSFDCEYESDKEYIKIPEDYPCVDRLSRVYTEEFDYTDILNDTLYVADVSRLGISTDAGSSFSHIGRDQGLDVYYISDIHFPDSTSDLYVVADDLYYSANDGNSFELLFESTGNLRKFTHFDINTKGDIVMSTVNGDVFIAIKNDDSYDTTVKDSTMSSIRDIKITDEGVIVVQDANGKLLSTHNNFETTHTYSGSSQAYFGYSRTYNLQKDRNRYIYVIADNVIHRATRDLGTNGELQFVERSKPIDEPIRAIDFGTNNAFFALTDSGLYRSDYSGQEDTWYKLSDNGKGALFGDSPGHFTLRTNGQTSFAVYDSYMKKLMVSKDTGANFSEVSQFAMQGTAKTVAVDDTDRVFVSGLNGNGLGVSHNEGKSFFYIDELSQTSVGHIVADGSDLFFTSGSKLYHTDDNGANYNIYEFGPSDDPLTINKFYISNDRRWFVATEKGIIYSDDKGQSFNKIVGSDALSSYIWELEFFGNEIYAKTADGLLYSDDSGNNFKRINKLGDYDLGSGLINIELDNYGRLLAIIDGVGTVMQDSNGSNQYSVIDSRGVSADKLFVDQNDKIYIFNSTSTYYPLRVSSDGGASFVSHSTINGLQYNEMTQIVNYKDTVAIATKNGLNIAAP